MGDHHALIHLNRTGDPSDITWILGIGSYVSKQKAPCWVVVTHALNPSSQEAEANGSL